MWKQSNNCVFDFNTFRDRSCWITFLSHLSELVWILVEDSNQKPQILRRLPRNKQSCFWCCDNAAQEARGLVSKGECVCWLEKLCPLCWCNVGSPRHFSHSTETHHFIIAVDFRVQTLRSVCLFVCLFRSLRSGRLADLEQLRTRNYRATQVLTFEQVWPPPPVTAVWCGIHHDTRGWFRFTAFSKPLWPPRPAVG